MNRKKVILAYNPKAGNGVLKKQSGYNNQTFSEKRFFCLAGKDGS